ncbi:MAG: hypothetical protein J1F06_06760 [Prevotellaceae bacterium]|nr:hypothetical protein [Prevotellaceae bacterium]
MKRTALLGILVFSALVAAAQSALVRAGHGLGYKAEADVSAAGGNTPFWLASNRYGVSGTDGSFGYLRAAVARDARQDSASVWRIGYGADFVAGYGLASKVFVQQLYADFDWRWLRLSAGQKERPMEMKHARLSTGSQTLGVNARPLPVVRIELPEYVNIAGKSRWVAVKGHVAYGLQPDGRFQRDYVGPAGRYAEHALYHSKAGYLRVGNESRFPLTLEGGLEWVTQFGGTIRNFREGDVVRDIRQESGLKGFVHAFTGTGSDETDGAQYANATGNTLGSWLLSLKYRGDGWAVRAYYDHYFEDHSQLFWQYGWRDGLVGVELTLPHNRAVSTLVYEYINTEYQSGPVYHDFTSAIPDQISGRDNYYYHSLYQGNQNFGQAMGNPLFTSPLYNKNSSLDFTDNRFRAHHVGLEGSPAEGLDYRMLYTHQRSLGSYNSPAPDPRKMNALLVEARYAFGPQSKVRGLYLGAALGVDRGSLTGDNTGFSFTVGHRGLLVR